MKKLAVLLLLAVAIRLSAAEIEKRTTDAASRVISESEGNIATLLARILERSHYTLHPLNDEISGKLFTRYLEVLDSQHLQLLQADLQEFEKYRLTLDELILKRRDTRAAHQIFARFLERFEQRYAFVQEILQTEPFEFKSDDRYALNRKDLPRPKDLDAAKELWRRQLRFEYLQEKLSAPPLTNSMAARKPAPANGPTNQAPAVWKGDRAEIVKTLTKRYGNLRRSYREFDDAQVFEIFMNAMTHAYDPHSDYMGKPQVDTFNIQMRLSLFGIGALLGSEDGYCKIIELKPGPAARSKQIKPNDRIVAVAQADKEPVDVIDMPLNKVVEMIRGPKGSEIRLTVLPADSVDASARKVVTLIRDEIKLEDGEAKAKVFEIPDGKGKTRRLGVVDLPSFYEDFGTPGGQKNHKSTTTDVAKLLAKLNTEKVDGIVLDLRRNPGGSLNEAVNLTGLFIKDGPVVQVKDSKGEIDVDSDTNPSILFGGPVVVLTSRFSASASEILAAALQDYGRAVIVGDKSTHGKGTVQTIYELEPIMNQNGLKFDYNPGALKFTIKTFYRANGSSTQFKGVIPDIILPSILNYAEVGEESLENAIPHDEIGAARFERTDMVTPFLADLRKLSLKRTDSEKDFLYVGEDIEQFRKQLADKTLSLNEARRRQEKTEAEARIEARKKERKSRKPADEKVFEVTLKNADQPGLQPPQKKDDDLTVRSRIDDEDLAEDADPSIDVTLEEARRILLDLIHLTEKGPKMLTTTSPKKVPTP